MKSNIFITGFSGSGKTTVSRRVARTLGWRFVDTDDEIVKASGKSIRAVFEEEGEASFRRLEHQCLTEVCKAELQVVSTGGGMVMEQCNRRLMERSGIIVCLEAAPQTIYRRLLAEQGSEEGSVVRPMLLDPDPLGRIAALKSERQSNYALAHWAVHTDHLTPEEAADEVVRAWGVLSRHMGGDSRSSLGRPSEESLRGAGPMGLRTLRRNTDPSGASDTFNASMSPRAGSGTSAVKGEVDRDLAATVRTSSGDYPIWVGWGTLGELGERVRHMLAPGAAYVVTDEGAYRHGRSAQVSLEAAGVPCHMFVIPPGETSKTLETAQRLYEWLASRRAERGHLVLAVGGGVVGDVAGFVAATFLRGVAFGQVPTSLLAMTDAAIGGKTAVDLPAGKNLVGAFYQPKFVLQDVETLETLPNRELRSGWAEAIKHGLILDAGLLRTFEKERKAILSLDRRVSTDVIRRSVAIKADVVSRDEKETLGFRVILNYGHTIGHAIEVATGYSRYLHGEAVSVGMMGAAMIGNSLGLMTDSEVDRQRAVLKSYGLSVTFGGIDLRAVLEAMALDKKKTAGSIHWVLLDGIGHAVTRADVPEAIVADALRNLRS